MEINLSIIFWVHFPDFHVSCTNSTQVQEIKKKIEDLNFQLPEKHGSRNSCLPNSDQRNGTYHSSLPCLSPMTVNSQQ